MITKMLGIEWHRNRKDPTVGSPEKSPETGTGRWKCLTEPTPTSQARNSLDTERIDVIPLPIDSLIWWEANSIKTLKSYGRLTPRFKLGLRLAMKATVRSWCDGENWCWCDGGKGSCEGEKASCEGLIRRGRVSRRYLLYIEQGNTNNNPLSPAIYALSKPSTGTTTIAMGTVDPHGFSPSRRDADAGAMFVLESKGKWWHAGFHLTTAIVGPTILTLPYAFRGMGWAVGIVSLTAMAMVTFYSYYLMSKVLDHCEKEGRRHIRFRELAADVLGKMASPSFIFFVILCFSLVAVSISRMKLASRNPENCKTIVLKYQALSAQILDFGREGVSFSYG
ncbi:putative GABA transporter 2 [Nymphaea thermarum]|nr:putative GABA transporter 2 [Nymphaea thermarum]